MITQNAMYKWMKWYEEKAQVQSNTDMQQKQIFWIYACMN